MATCGLHFGYDKFSRVPPCSEWAAAAEWIRCGLAEANMTIPFQDRPHFEINMCTVTGGQVNAILWDLTKKKFVVVAFAN